ncbi:hypothetical protein QF001_000181 [Paraburkholderia youngii]
MPAPSNEKFFSINRLVCVATVDDGDLSRCSRGCPRAVAKVERVDFHEREDVFTFCLLREQAKMIRTLLSDEVWARIESVLPGKEGDPERTATDNRWFVEAVLWIGRTGCP